MEIVPVILLFCMWNMVSALRCFQCYMVEKPYYFQDGLSSLTCNDFDYSNKFIVECPSSTFCYKRTARTHFYGKEFIREARGCAPQEYVGQKYDDFLGFSEERYVVKDAYKSECVAREGFGLRLTESADCFCNSDLCNSGDQLKISSIYSYLCFVVVLCRWFSF
ncbi:hypothetical protein GWI33_004272 [Rhynchophorus ferrugineus]|uniref:Protein sleepless n=1 Tax=Rhynchophorus ferrugineus TaxID=354439 RepID=A0A834MIU9_RHYFE|nr:hypothetical protein GWI33_004272 [Rhynchophorus ferrugineus]